MSILFAGSWLSEDWCRCLLAIFVVVFFVFFIIPYFARDEEKRKRLDKRRMEAAINGGDQKTIKSLLYDYSNDNEFILETKKMIEEKEKTRKEELFGYLLNFRFADAEKKTLPSDGSAAKLVGILSRQYRNMKDGIYGEQGLVIALALQAYPGFTDWINDKDERKYIWAFIKNEGKVS